MSDIEDAIRAAMRRADAAAPTTGDFHFRAPTDSPALPRRRWVAVLSAAAVVAAVAATIVGVTAQRSNVAAPPAGPTGAADAALTCPAAAPAFRSPTTLYPLPQPRSDALTANGSLVPAIVPTRAVVCAYVHPHPDRLAGSRVFTADLTVVADYLSRLPPGPATEFSCALDLRPTDGDLYLIGLSYRANTLWVSAPDNHCLGASNGQFTTSAHVADDAKAAYASGTWTPPTTNRSGLVCPLATGRLGQQTVMVPGEPVSVVVCRQTPAPIRRSGTEADLQALITSLNALKTAPDQHAFQCSSPGVPKATYSLTFAYPTGPTVAIWIYAGCTAAIHNGNLSATDDSTVLPIIQQILTRTR